MGRPRNWIVSPVPSEDEGLCVRGFLVGTSFSKALTVLGTLSRALQQGVVLLKPFFLSVEIQVGALAFPVVVAVESCSETSVKAILKYRNFRVNLNFSTFFYENDKEAKLSTKGPSVNRLPTSVVPSAIHYPLPYVPQNLFFVFPVGNIVLNHASRVRHMRHSYKLFRRWLPECHCNRLEDSDLR